MTATQTRPQAADADAETDKVRSVERAADILGYLSRAAAPVGVVEMERALGLRRPTLYRLLHTLEGKGFVRSVGDPQRFTLGFRVVELARTWLGRSDFATIARPYLDRLWRETRETVALFVLGEGGRSRVCVYEQPSPEALVFTRGVGWVEDLTVGASGLAILGSLDPSARDAVLDDVTPAKRRAALQRRLAELARTGYAVSAGDIIAGAASLAAPVFDHRGTVRGAVSLFGPATRVVGGHRENCLRRLLQAARDMTAAAGGGIDETSDLRQEGNDGR